MTSESGIGTGGLVAIIIIFLILALVFLGLFLWYFFKDRNNGNGNGTVGPTGPTGPSGNGDRNIRQFSSEINVPQGGVGIVTVSLPSNMAGAHYYFTNLLVPGQDGGNPTILTPNGPYVDNVPIKWNTKLNGSTLSVIFMSQGTSITTVGIRVTAIMPHS